MTADLINRLFDALNAHDLTEIRALLSDGFVFEEVAGAGVPSREALCEELRMIFEGLPDLVFRPVRQTQEAGRTYVEFRAMGTHRGRFLGIEPSGGFALMSGVFNLSSDEARISRLRLTIDFGGLRRQLLLAARRPSTGG